jgi:hypothetical protein
MVFTATPRRWCEHQHVVAAGEHGAAAVQDLDVATVDHHTQRRVRVRAHRRLQMGRHVRPAGRRHGGEQVGHGGAVRELELEVAALQQRLEQPDGAHAHRDQASPRASAA